MTQSTPPQPHPDGGYSMNPAPVPPPSMSSPLAPIVAEKKRASALSLLLGFALVVAVGGVAFAAGRLTAPAPAAASGGGRGTFGGGGGTGTGTGFGGGNGFQPGASGQPGGGAGFGGLGGADLTLTGTVQSISPTSITLKTQNGQTVDIPIDSSTTYHGQQAATSTDVKTGATVQIALSGGFGGGFGGGRGRGAGASAPPPVGGGAAPSSGTGAGASAPAASGGPGTGFGGRGGALGPARDITIVTP